MKMGPDEGGIHTERDSYLLCHEMGKTLMRHSFVTMFLFVFLLCAVLKKNTLQLKFSIWGRDGHLERPRIMWKQMQFESTRDWMELIVSDGSMLWGQSDCSHKGEREETEVTAPVPVGHVQNEKYGK